MLAHAGEIKGAGVGKAALIVAAMLKAPLPCGASTSRNRTRVVIRPDDVVSDFDSALSVPVPPFRRVAERSHLTHVDLHNERDAARFTEEIAASDKHNIPKPCS